MRILLSFALLALSRLAISPHLSAQDIPYVVELHAEALAAGLTIALPAAGEWAFGIDLSAGKHLAFDLTDAGEDVDLYATGYATVRWRPNDNVQISISPIGVAAVVGNDFGTVYPSARLGGGWYWGRFGVGTEFRVIRIAGGFGSGDYWVQWSPVRVGFRL